MKQLNLVAEGLIGALMMAVAIFTFWLPYWRKWGATDAEIKRSLPCDDMISEPMGGYTHAITINAPRQQVWLWVAQIGQERGGFYSYDFLENLVGLKIHSVDKIIPEYRHDEKSLGLKLHPKVLPLPLACIEPERTLAFGGPVDPNTPASWLFFMEDAGENCTRLISRWRFSYKPSIGFRIAFGVIVQSIACIMQIKMLLGIKKRAERVFKGAVVTRPQG